MKRKVVFLLGGAIIGAIEIALGWMCLPDNFLGVYLIFIGLGYCIGGAIFLGFSSSELMISQSDRSLIGLVPGALLVLVALPVEYLYFSAVLPRGLWMQWVGLTVVVLGMGLRVWTRHVLKKAYQGHLQVVPGQELVVWGPYRWIRHPGYLGFALQALGLVIGFSSLSGLIGMLLLGLPLRYRIQLEEAMLVRAFGSQYEQYQRHTSRLFPGIW